MSLGKTLLLAGLGSAAAKTYFKETFDGESFARKILSATCLPGVWPGEAVRVPQNKAEHGPTCPGDSVLSSATC
jgi:hypothetical protein